MRAKEYAERYKANRTAQELADIIAALAEEAVELQRVRQARSEAAQYAILNEQDQKWRAFARIVGDVKEDGFEMVIKKLVPEHYEGWKRYRRRG